MVAALIIVSVLLALAVAYIFCLHWVLKNTLDMVDRLLDLEAKSPGKAYNDKYYDATIIVNMLYNQPNMGKIVDLSLFEEKKIASFTILTTESFEDAFTKEELIKAAQEQLPEEITDEDERAAIIEQYLPIARKQLMKPLIIKDAQIYEVWEGEWTWKSA